MKKILLFGTMLGVAATALAFGGVFSHGSKSSTYKGGVDAIGVHFGGEKKTADSQPEEGTCPTEKQCGDYCCGHDNVCKTESGELQCCDEARNYCCPSGQSVWPHPGSGAPQCCEGNTYYHYCYNNICEKRCCETGKTVICALYDTEGKCITEACCPSADFTPLCDIGKAIDSNGVVSCGGPGFRCCSGTVTYGEGWTPDTCDGEIY